MRISGIKFQFQTGSIKRDTVHGFEGYEDEFQFQTGSIKRGLLYGGGEKVMAVSIPNWFD